MIVVEIKLDHNMENIQKLKNTSNIEHVKTRK